MAECIDRETLINNLELLARHEDRFRRCAILGVVETIRAMKAADVAPVVHGRWEQVKKYATKDKYRCSVCGREIMSAVKVNIEKYPYCHCGAKMDGGDNTER